MYNMTIFDLNWPFLPFLANFRPQSRYFGHEKVMFYTSLNSPFDEDSNDILDAWVLSINKKFPKNGKFLPWDYFAVRSR